MKSIKEKQNSVYEKMKGEFGYKNSMAAPKLVKITLSSGTGMAMKKDQKVNDKVVDRIAKITGQKASVKGAKKSIATFKIREGDPVGVTVTLRGLRMY